MTGLPTAVAEGVADGEGSDLLHTPDGVRGLQDRQVIDVCFAVDENSDPSE